MIPSIISRNSSKDKTDEYTNPDNLIVCMKSLHYKTKKNDDVVIIDDSETCLKK